MMTCKNYCRVHIMRDFCLCFDKKKKCQTKTTKLVVGKIVSDAGEIN